MRNNLLLLCVAIATSALLAFTLNSDPPYDQLLAEEYKTEFVKKTDSEQLRTNLADVYSHDFDAIEFVDLHQADENDFYYVAYGMKDGKAVAQMINVTNELAMRENYPSRADMGIAADKVVINCYCAWIFCTHNGEGRVCGIALDTMSACQPAFCKLKPKPIDQVPN